jgi:hypothetical protein
MNAWPVWIGIALLGATCAGSGSRVPAQTDDLFYAKYAEPCGRSLLGISRSPDGPFELVEAPGPESPVDRLRYDVLLSSRFKVWGHLTGAIQDDNHCGAFPVFAVARFEAWGNIQRCAHIGSLGEASQYFTEGLPIDQFVASDTDGPAASPIVDAESCRPRNGDCATGQVAVTNCDGSRWCCRLQR